MQLTRIFHPVGQGAFYTERLSLAGKNFNIVYDCGSVTLKDKKIRTMVNANFLKDEVIDLLFISHFHADHISGIQALKEQCDIRHVVIPYLDQKTKALVKISNLIAYNFRDTLLIDNPAAFFNSETRVIFIDDQNGNFDEVNDNILLLPEEYPERIKTVSGGIRIQLSAITEWLFVPYNFKQDAKLIAFETALDKIPLKLDAIETLEDILDHKSEITMAYRSISSDLNESSLLLYSGPIAALRIVSYSHLFHFDFWPWNRAKDAGCLYLGDINLNQSDIVTNIKNAYKHYWSKIITLQVPHHGAIKNFSSEILEIPNLKYAIFNFGTTNSFGHPSARVIGEVCTKRLVPLLITEQIDSLNIQVSEEAHT